MQQGVCKYLHDEVCCNDSSEYLAEFPSEIDCRHCRQYERKEKNDAKTTMQED